MAPCPPDLMDLFTSGSLHCRGGRAVRRPPSYPSLRAAPRASGRGGLHGLLGGRVQAWLDWRVQLVHLGSHSLWLSHVLELPLAVHGRTLSPAALLALGALREVLELVGHLAHLPLLGEVRWHGGILEAVRLQLLYGRKPLVLVHGVAREQEREHVPHPRVLGELVQAGHL